MNLAELKERLRAAKLYPIPVEDDMNEIRGLKFSGSLEEYFEAVHALGKTTIFITAQIFGEDDFHYDMHKDSYDEDSDEIAEDEAEKIDLCLIDPAFEKFKDRINSVAVFKLSSSISDNSLTFYIVEKWWEEYSTLYFKVVQNIRHNQVEAQEKLKSAKKEKNKELVKAVRELRHDKHFSSLKTQRAMTTYAKEKIPELESLEPSLLRQEIQALCDDLKR